VTEDLTALRSEFPTHKIWRDETRGQVRYVARSRHLGLGPHTVITPSVAELRDALAPVRGMGTGAALCSPAEPNIARMYSYWLAGKDHYEADRAAADKILQRYPEVAGAARANRAFVSRAVRYVARHGIRQFLDIGSGLPTSPNVHETARAVNAGARVVYVDRDPVVLAHARALLAVDDEVGVVAGDVGDPWFLADPALTQVIDSHQPVCLLLTSVLHFLPAAEADAAVATLRDWMPGGSYLVISAGTSTGTDPELIRCLQSAYGDIPVTGRTAAEIEAWFTGLSLVRPGLVDAWAWRPDTLDRRVSPRARILAGIGHKPKPQWTA
jgi:O-methyltransferase involved in polyketide biosynthesis